MGIVYLGLTYSSSNFEYTGTGVWIASNKILTCAHNLGTYRRRSIHFQIEVITGRNGAASTCVSTGSGSMNLSCSCFMGEKRQHFPPETIIVL